MQLKKGLGDFIRCAKEIFQKTFTGPLFMNEVNALTLDLQNTISKKVDDLQKIANSKGLSIQEENDQFTIVTLGPDKANSTQHFEDRSPSYTIQEVQEIRQSLALITTDAHVKSMDINRQLRAKRRQEAEFIVQPLMRLLAETFAPYIKEWMEDLLTDVLDHIDEFMLIDSENLDPADGEFFNRYGVNVIVNNQDSDNPAVILEPNPTYESLFGSLKYKSTASGFMTDFYPYSGRKFAPSQWGNSSVTG